MSLRVGEVIGVRGVQVSLRIDEESSREILFFKGSKYKGISIREYLAIQRGFRTIVCVVEGEYLDERKTAPSGTGLSYIRKVEVKPVGYFDGDEFRHGIKFLPMIKDAAYLLREEQIEKIFGNTDTDGFVVGSLLKEELPVTLPWRQLFNSHIGIFGNTGSGKSNTLAKLFTTLFQKKGASIVGKSGFVLIDFNGEYVGNQLTNTSKVVYRLTTNTNDGDRFPLPNSEFWDLETLSLIFQATQNTQRPFLARIINGRAKYEANQNSLTNYAKATFRLAISAARPRPESLDLLRRIATLLHAEALNRELRDIAWHGGVNKFYKPRDYIFFDSEAQYDLLLANTVEQLDLSHLDPFDQLIARANLQLARDLTYGHVQFDHIQPLLKRIDSSLIGLRKVLAIGWEPPQGFLLTVVSLRRCNNEVKKILPLLLAKYFYGHHKSVVQQPPDKTLHLIVDEAHNILSQQSAREQENWKDYRLELFEEIIKEGRKFGVFVTIASQRPADISPTIVSQLHNFFIHRLVNDRDLFLVDNTLTTLDTISRSLIPNLSKGSCVVTGTSFDMPLLLQIDPLQADMRPFSEDVDLELLWRE